MAQNDLLTYKFLTQHNTKHVSQNFKLFNIFFIQNIS